MSDNTSDVDGNLDITTVDNDELDELASRIEGFYKKDSSVKARLSYSWERNHKFLDGQHWLVFDGNRDTGGTWSRLQVSRANEYIPRPVTNYVFDAYQTLKGYLLKNKPRSTVRPNTDNFRDKAAADIGDLCLQANWKRLQEEKNYEYAAACILTYGTVFKKSHWDVGAGGFVKVPKMEPQPQTDPQTGQQTGVTMVHAIDPETGDLLFDELPLGDLDTGIVEPQRMALDPSANDLHKAKWIMEYSIHPVAWIKASFDRQEPGYTGRSDEVTEERALQGSLKRFIALKNSSGVKTSTLGGGDTNLNGNSGGDSNMSNQAVVKEYYEAPSKDHPQGRLVVVANGIPLYAGDSPCDGPEEGDWHPYSECRWEILPGRFWGKTCLDEGCEINKRINSIDSVIQLTRKTTAIPQRLIPTSAGIQPGQWTGRPGLEIPYRDSGGAKPELLPGVGVDGSVFQERALAVEDLKNVMGNMDILKGDRPPGVTAASALNLLYEVGTGKLYPVLDRYNHFIENDQKKQLRVISKHYKEPRPTYIALLQSMNEDLSPEAINKFIGTDLLDNCNVIIEAGSNIPKLHAAQQAALQEAAQGGTLGLEQPSNRNEYNRQLGISGFDNDVGPDMDRASWENDLLDNFDLKPEMPTILIVDDDQIHMDTLARRMKKPSFMSCSMAVQQAYMQHYQAHDKAASDKQTQQIMQAMASGQPPGPPPNANAPTPMHGTHGGGPTKQEKNALSTDMAAPGVMK